MKATDLMPGDLVTFKDCQNDEKPTVIKIWQPNGDGHALAFIDGDKALDEIAIDDEVVGIPLTPKILEKNGCKKAKFNDDEPSGLCGKWWSKDGLVLIKMFEFTLLGKVFSVSANNSRISNIRYVHELQHALRLCGIDKEVVV